MGESTAGPWGQPEGPAASPMVLSTRMSSRSSYCLESLVMCCTQEGLAAFVALTKQCSSHSSSQKSSSLSPTFQISAHAQISGKNLIVQSNVGVRRWDQPCPGVGLYSQALAETSLHFLLVLYKPSSTFAKLRQVQPPSLPPSGLEGHMPWRELLLSMPAATGSPNKHH